MKILGVESQGMPSQFCGTQDYKVVLVQFDETHPSAIAIRGVGEAEWVARHGDPIRDPAHVNAYFPNVVEQLKIRGLVYSDHSL